MGRVRSGGERERAARRDLDSQPGPRRRRRARAVSERKARRRVTQSSDLGGHLRAGEVQGLPVIAMELAPGGTLKDSLVDGQPLAPPAAVDAILQVVAGLHEAAALGILHRASSRRTASSIATAVYWSANPAVDCDAGPRAGSIGRHGHDCRHTRLCLARAASRGTARRALRHLLGRGDDLLPVDRPSAVRGRARDSAGDAHGDGNPGLAGRHSPRRSTGLAAVVCAAWRARLRSDTRTIARWRRRSSRSDRRRRWRRDCRAASSRASPTASCLPWH